MRQMQHSVDGSPRSSSACEVCGESSAQPVNVTFGDGNAKTFDLCEGCLDDFRAGELVDEVDLLDDGDHCPAE